MDISITDLVENERLVRFTADAPVGESIYIEHDGRLFLFTKIKETDTGLDLRITELI